MFTKHLILTLVSFGFAGSMTHQAAISSTPEPIKVNIVLDMQCDLDGSAFAIKNLDTGKFHRIHADQAYFTAQKGDSLQLQLHPKYGNRHFTSPSFRATSFQKIQGDCQRAHIPSFIQKLSAYLGDKSSLAVLAQN